MQDADGYSGMVDVLLRAFHWYVDVGMLLLEGMPLIVNVAALLWFCMPIVIMMLANTSEHRVVHACGWAVFLPWCVGMLYLAIAKTPVGMIFTIPAMCAQWIGGSLGGFLASAQDLPKQEYVTTGRTIGFWVGLSSVPIAIVCVVTQHVVVSLRERCRSRR